MTRKDTLFESYMNHPMILENPEDVCKSLKEGLESPNLVIGTIATFVDIISKYEVISDDDLKRRINIYLNSKIN